MELYEAIRNRQADVIAQNSASIIISRTARTDDGAGGYTNTTTTKTAQVMRIYNKNTRILNVVDGGYQAQRLTKMIAKYDADILSESATNLDTFTYGSKNYKVKDVKDIYTQGYIVFKEVYIEEIT